MNTRRGSTNSSSDNSPDQSGLDNFNLQTSPTGSSPSGSTVSSLTLEGFNDRTLGNNTSDNQLTQPTTALDILLTSSTTLPPQQQPNLTNFTTYTIDNGLITFNEPFTVRLPLVIYSLSGSTPQNYVVNANTYTILSDIPTRVIDNVVYGSRMIDLRDPNYNLIQYYSRDGYRERISAYELVPSLLNDLSQIVNELDYLRHNNLRP